MGFIGFLFSKPIWLTIKSALVFRMNSCVRKRRAGVRSIEEPTSEISGEKLNYVVRRIVHGATQIDLLCSEC